MRGVSLMAMQNTITSAYGVKLPPIIYGTAWKKERTAEWVKQALTMGFRGIDTACQPKHYNEAGVGEGIAAALAEGLLNRDELYLQTKFTPVSGQDPARIPYDAQASLAEQISQSCQRSLQNLQVNVLDCLVLHSPLASFNETQLAWQAMEQLQVSGLVKQLGISNCYDTAFFTKLYSQAEIKPAILQNRFYAKTSYDQTLRQFCLEHNIIYQSFWTLTANPHVLSNADLLCIAQKYQRSAAQVLFRYLTQIGIVPLTGTTSPVHMSEDLQVEDFCLSVDEISEITELF
jgi:diketogulonate reductase-like aldo/keto reductase